MDKNDVPGENVDLAEIRRHVRIEHVLVQYAHLIDQMIVVHPSELHVDHGLAASSNLAPERFLVLLPSPFRSPDDPLCSVVVFPQNNVWTDFTNLKPANIPVDMAGFVMAYDRCDRDLAIKKLEGLAAEIRQSDPDEIERYYTEFRRALERSAERSLNASEVSKIRQQVLRRLSN